MYTKTKIFQIYEYNTHYFQKFDNFSNNFMFYKKEIKFLDGKKLRHIVYYDLNIYFKVY